MTAPKDGLCGDPGRRLGQEEVLAIMQAVLQLCGAGKLRCSEKTQRSACGARIIGQRSPPARLLDGLSVVDAEDERVQDVRTRIMSAFKLTM